MLREYLKDKTNKNYIWVPLVGPSLTYLLLRFPSLHPAALGGQVPCLPCSHRCSWGPVSQHSSHYPVTVCHLSPSSRDKKGFIYFTAMTSHCPRSLWHGWMKSWIGTQLAHLDLALVTSPRRSTTQMASTPLAFLPPWTGSVYLTLPPA